MISRKFIFLFLPTLIFTDKVGLMRVYSNIDEFESVACPVLTTGTFDGVHLGHKKIISRLLEIADRSSGESVLLSFNPHPRMVLFPDDTRIQLLSSQKEKIKLLEESGIDHLIIHPFTREFSRLSSVEFVRDLLVNKLGIKKLVIGYNHQFGRNREGTLEHLKEYGPVYGFDVEEIPAEEIDNVNISSTKIRDALSEGNVTVANSFLGYSYSLEGDVVRGKEIGRTIGFPTANIEIRENEKLIPKDGVYAARAEVNGKQYNGMLNIGYNPTVEKGKTDDRRNTIEINLFDFDDDIYGSEIEVELIERIRDERKFEDLTELKNQLALDKTETNRILAG